jgi:hypothetical protein
MGEEMEGAVQQAPQPGRQDTLFMPGAYGKVTDSERQKPGS